LRIQDVDEHPPGPGGVRRAGSEPGRAGHAGTAAHHRQIAEAALVVGVATA
jgi:hypothetical protein